MARRSWIDKNTNDVLIDDYAKQLGSFLETFEDGVVEAKELEAQEDRVVTLMKEIEPKLDDELHEQMTKLLCELSAFDIMAYTFELQQARAKAVWRP